MMQEAPQRGIIQKAAPQKQMPQEPEGDVSQVTQDVDPAALEEFLDASAEVVTQTEPQIAASLQKGGLVQAAAIVFDRVDSEFAGISDLTRFFGGIGVLNQIAKIAEKNGVKNLSEKEKLQAISTILAAQVKKGIESGKYDPQEMLDAANAAKQKIQMAGGATREQTQQTPPAQQGVEVQR